MLNVNHTNNSSNNSNNNRLGARPTGQRCGSQSRRSGRRGLGGRRSLISPLLIITIIKNKIIIIIIPPLIKLPPNESHLLGGCFIKGGTFRRKPCLWTSQRVDHHSPTLILVPYHRGVAYGGRPITPTRRALRPESTRKLPS